MIGSSYTGTPSTDPQGSAHFTAALLQATLTARKVIAVVSLLWDGPQLWTFACSLGLGESPENVERLAGALALAAGAETCRIGRMGGRLTIEIPKPAAQRKVLRAARLEALPPPNPTSAVAGIATGGQAVWLDLADERTCHILIGGTTGSGKTVALHWLIYRWLRQNSPDELRLVALDPKHELQVFAQAPHLMGKVTSEPGEIARALVWAGQELSRRIARGQSQPRLLIVAEEVADLVNVKPEVSSTLARIAQVGRGVGVHLIATTQHPGAKSLGTALANFPARLLGRVATATLSYGAAGRARTGAENLLGRGDFLLLAAGSDPVRLQIPLMDGRQLGQVPHGPRPTALPKEDRP